MAYNPGSEYVRWQESQQQPKTLQQQADSGSLTVLGRGYTAPANSGVLTQEATRQATVQSTPFKRLQKEGIEQSVVDRGLQTGASGASTFGGGAGGRSSYTDEEIAFMTGGGGGSPVAATGTPAPAPSGGGGGGGTPAPEAPAGPGAATDPAAGQFADFTEQEIDAALRGIEAEFGMTREQLLQDKSMIGAQYRLLMARLNRARTQGLASATNDAVSRGIYRSGILGENLANVEQEFSEEESANRQQQQIQEQGIERQLAFLDQGQAAAQAQAQNRILGQAAATMGQAGLNPAQAGFAPAPVVGVGGDAGQTPYGAGGQPMLGAPTGVIPRAPMGPGAIMPEPNAMVANPYAGFPVVGGYYIDPQTGMAVARVDGR